MATVGVKAFKGLMCINNYRYLCHFSLNCVIKFNCCIYIRQVSLLRAHAGEHLLLSAAHRSLSYSDLVLLGNDTVLSRDTTDPGVARLVARMIDDVICVLRDVSVDDVEMACLKAIIFFDPGQ